MYRSYGLTKLSAILLLIALHPGISALVQDSSATHLPRTLLGVWSPTYNTWNISDPLILIGATFELTVNVTEVVELAGFDVAFTFDPDVIAVVNPCELGTSDPCDEADELNFQNTVFSDFQQVDDFAARANNLLGVRVTRNVFSPESFTGNGVLFRVPFKVAGRGSTDISFRASSLLNFSIEEIVHDRQNGRFSNAILNLPIPVFFWTWIDNVNPDGIVTAGERVIFDGSESYDPDAAPGSPNNGIVRYHWSLGNATGSEAPSEPVVSHVFRRPDGRPAAGEFTVTLRVWDADDMTAADSQQLFVTSFTALVDIDITSANDPSDRQQVEPTIAVHPLKPEILVAGAQDLRLLSQGWHRWHGYYRSTDGGKTWTSTLVPGFPGDTSPESLSSPLRMFNATSDPVLAFDRAGNVYYVGLGLNITASGGVRFDSIKTFIAKYTNDGSTFSGVTIVDAFNADKPWIAVDNSGGPYDGHVYVVFDAELDGRFTSVFTRSVDDGRTFSPVVAVPPEGGLLPGVAVDGDGNVYVSAIGYDPVNDTLFNFVRVSKLISGGTSVAFTSITAENMVFSPSPLPGNGFRTFPIPQIAADDKGVYVVWDDYRAGNADVMISRSFNGGLSWSAPVKVNDDVGSSHQFFPSVTVAAGIVHVVWYDARLGQLETGAITGLNVFHAQSVDGGATFSANTRVTSVSFDPNLVLRTDPPGQSFPFMGDYIHVAATDAHAHPIWADNRNACNNNDPVLGCLDQDVFTAAVPVVVPQPDFSITAIPALVTIDPDQTADSSILLTSIARFEGEIGLSVEVCCGSGLPRAVLNRFFVSLPSGGNASATLTVSFTDTTLEGTYNVQVIATSREILHVALVVVRAALTANQPPVALFSFSPREPFVGDFVFLDGSASFDPDGFVSQWTWQFGDGDLGFGSFSSHAYRSPGSYVVTLTVTDNQSAAGSRSETILVRTRPTHDVAVVDVQVQLRTVVSTQTVPIVVLVSNQGLQEEIVDVNLFYDSQLIDSIQGLRVSPQVLPVYIPFAWDTEDVPPGRYTVSAEAVLAVDENPGNNRFVDGTVEILPPPALATAPPSGFLGSKIVVTGSGFPSQLPFPFFGPRIALVSFDDMFVGFTTIDNDGGFEFTFNLPHAEPGVHRIKALDVITGARASAGFEVLPEPPRVVDLDFKVAVDVGVLYFPGDTADIYVLTSLNGRPVGPEGVTVQLTIIGPGQAQITLDASPVGQGLYKASFNIRGTSSIGTYAVLASAHHVDGFSASGLSSFEVKQSWITARGPAIASASAAAGIIAVATVAWRKGYLRRKDKSSASLWPTP